MPIRDAMQELIDEGKKRQKLYDGDTQSVHERHCPYCEPWRCPHCGRPFTYPEPVIWC